MVFLNKSNSIKMLLGIENIENGNEIIRFDWIDNFDCGFIGKLIAAQTFVYV